MIPSTKMASKYYPSTGQCVFCLRSFAPGDLTDEHVIPRALNGDYILRDGACVECARDGNQRFEQIALNADFLVPRLMLELRRRKKSQKKQLPLLGLGIEGSDEFRWVEVQAALYPPIISLIAMEPAGLLSGVDRGSALTNIRIQDYFLPRGLGALQFSSFTTKHVHDHTAFALSVAKMAYCFAAGEFGIDSFDGADIRDLIRGRRDDAYNFVGGISQREHLSDASLHGLYLRYRTGFVTVIVHLFASCKMEAYEVVVGRLTEGPASMGDRADGAMVELAWGS